MVQGQFEQVFSIEQSFLAALCTVEAECLFLLGGFSMTKPLTKNEPNQPLEDCANRNRILEAVHTFLTKAAGSSSTQMCLECGSTVYLQIATISLWSTGETWQVTLPLCEVCAFQGDAGSNHFEYEYSEPGGARKRLRVQ